MNEISTFPAQAFQLFEKKQLQDFLEISHYTSRLRTPDDVNVVLEKIQKLLPFGQIIGGLAQLSSEGRFEQYARVYNVSYPNDWLYVYAKNGYAEVDPVFLSLMRQSGGQIWSNTYEGVKQRKQQAFIEEARAFGLTNGVTVSRHAQNMVSFFSFAGDCEKDNERFLPVIQYLLEHVHEVLFEQRPVAGTPLTAPLSPREITVLNWMKLGKTNGEIAMIIGISERTVRFHAERIYVKLDVTSRAQAVACAMEQGLLSPQNF
jgi:LuxR family transcriptional regulator, quorum-sensing system regulator CviR